MIACGSSSSFGSWPWRWCRSAAWWRGLKSLGKATPWRRSAASFSRRSAISWFVSAAVAPLSGGVGGHGRCCEEQPRILGARCHGASRRRRRGVGDNPTPRRRPREPAAACARARRRTPTECTFDAHRSATARSASPWSAAAASRRTTSRPSASMPPRPNWWRCATTTRRRCATRCGKTQAQGFASLTALLAGCAARLRGAGHAQRAASAAGHRGGRRRRRRDDRKADGHALERRPGDGARLRRGGRAPVRRQAEPPQPHLAAAQAGACTKGRFGRDLHGQRQRLLVAAAGLLRQRRLARHLGVRRRRVHEPGQPLRRPARLAGRPGGKRDGLHRHAGAQHRGRGHRRGRAEVAQRRDGLDQRHHAHLAEEPGRLDHHPRREGQRARRRRGGEPDRALAVRGQRPDGRSSSTRPATRPPRSTASATRCTTKA